MKSRFARTLPALLCALCLILAAAPARAEVPGVYTYATVTGTLDLNVRSGPGTEYAVIGNVPQGTVVGVLSEYGNWYQVYVPSLSMNGYMSKNYLTLTSSPSPSTPAASTMPASGTGVVSNPNPSSYVNLRQSPSMSAPVLGIYYNGAVFTLLAATSDGWYQVQINGNIGYFRHEYVTVNGGNPGGGGAVPPSGQTGYVYAANGKKVNLRSLPSYAGSTIIGQYPSGTPLTVLSASGAFWTVQVQGTVGYMDSTFISVSGGGVSPNPRPQTRGTATVNNPRATQFLNLRAQPSTTAKVIAQYKNGTRFEVIAPGETWTKVYGSATGNVGYFMTKYLKLSGVSASPTKTVKNNGSYVNLRTAPRKVSGNVSVQVPHGATVTVLTPGDEWTQVRYGSRVGYMMTAFLK